MVCYGSEQIVVSVVLNSESKGEFFALMSGDGDFLLTTQDLKDIGFTTISGITEEFEGQSYVSLRSMDGVDYDFDEKTLTLSITADPSLLQRYTIDFSHKRASDVIYPAQSSAFLNYALTYSEGDFPEYPDLSITNELGIRSGSLLFLTDSIYTKSSEENKFVRLMTSFTYDRRDELDRFVAGDLFAHSGLLGSNVNMGGFSYSKVYDMDPYFISYPTLDISGFVSMPSEIEVYLDNMRIDTEKVPSGRFELKNLYYYGGAHKVDVVLRDPFGKERRLSYPFYFDDRLLKKGLHEFSYNIGFLRKDFGVKSNIYTSLALVAFHRYGLRDYLTAGLSIEAMDGLYNLGGESTVLLGMAGTATLALYGSLLDGEEGLAGSFEWLYQKKNLSARIFLRGFSEDYTTIGNRSSTERTSYEATAGISYGNIRLGTLSLDISASSIFHRTDRRTIMATYTRGLTSRSTVFATYKRIWEDGPSQEFFFGINYYPWNDAYLTAQYTKTDESETEFVQFQKNAPFGEGFGLRGSYQRSASGSDHSSALNSSFQYNSRYAVLRADYSGQKEPSDSRDLYQLSVSGSLGYIGGILRPSRPIHDSFALVKVGDIEGVRVYVNNQEAGRTGPDGLLLVPDIGSYYDNIVSIEDRDIPIEYSIGGVEKTISPPLRSGSCIGFSAKRFQAVTGRLFVKSEGVERPVEFRSVTISRDGFSKEFVTGKGGEFYIEDLNKGGGPSPAYDEKVCRFSETGRKGGLKEGTYRVTFSYGGKVCSTGIAIPGSSDIMVDIGEVLCEIPPEEVETTPEITGFPDILFSPDSYSLEPEYTDELDGLVKALKENKDLIVTIEGHCDETGSKEYNLQLGMKRALAVRNYLVRAGVEPGRIGVESYGKERPLCREKSEECRHRNRRVHIRIER